VTGLGDPRAICVGEERVVVLREEPRRSGRVRIGERPALDVEELDAGLVPESAQPRPERVEDLGEASQARPGLSVTDARRPERAEVPEHELVPRAPCGERAAEPRLRREENRFSRPAPEAARRNLDERDERANRHPERVRVATGPPLAEERLERASSHGLPGEELAARLRDLVQVESVQRLAVVPAQAPLAYDLDEGPKLEAVRRGHEVDRRAHEDDADGAPFLQEPGEHVRIEPLEPRPQADVWGLRRLRLHADEVVERLGGRDPRALEQELPGEERAVQRAPAERLGSHV
jgi:hypothetical protein